MRSNRTLPCCAGSQNEQRRSLTDWFESYRSISRSKFIEEANRLVSRFKINEWAFIMKIDRYSLLFKVTLSWELRSLEKMVWFKTELLWLLRENYLCGIFNRWFWFLTAEKNARSKSKLERTHFELLLCTRIESKRTLKSMILLSMRSHEFRNRFLNYIFWRCPQLRSNLNWRSNFHLWFWGWFNKSFSFILI